MKNYRTIKCVKIKFINQFILYFLVNKWTTIGTVTIEPILLRIMITFLKLQWPIASQKSFLRKFLKDNSISHLVLGEGFSEIRLKWVKSKGITFSNLLNDTLLKIESHWTNNLKGIFKLSILKEPLQEQKSVKVSEINLKPLKYWNKKINL